MLSHNTFLRNEMSNIYFRANGEANSYSLFDKQTNRWKMTLLLNGEQVSASQAAYLERMAACWNACEGIDTDDLEAGSVSIIEKLHDDAAKLVRSERDDLLEAMKRIAQLSYDSEAIRVASAAIAKATGETE